MPRPESPEGKWVTVPVRVRESLLARIDAARGERNRSEWARSVLEAALDGVPAEAPVRKPSRERRPRGAPTAAELARERAEDARESPPASRTVTPAPAGVPAAAFQEPAEDAPAQPSWMSSLPTYDEVHGRGR